MQPSSKLNTLKQNAAALDQQAIPVISAGRILEAYSRNTFELLQHINELEDRLSKVPAPQTEREVPAKFA